MKNRSPLLRFAVRMPATSCSAKVLSALGVLSFASAALSQTARVTAPGALPVLKGVVSGQAVVNTPVTGASARLLTVDQASQRAIIDWKTFDIGSDAEVRFNQPNSTASVLNRIYDANPSVIAGKLTANGQVLLINQNGILFERGSQINLQSLVASSLNITDARYNSGALTTGGLTSPAFEGGYDSAGTTVVSASSGGVLIGTSGSSAAAASLKANAGGSIMIFAPRIEQRDALITAPDGQVILAAGGKVYLALPEAADTTLRGFQVEIDANRGTDVNLTSLIRNAGLISADRGNVTLAALALNQSGRVSANTAIQANGSVFLRARTLGSAQSGTVTLAAGSMTEVRPDAQDKSTLPESQSYLDRRGEVRVEGRTIASSGTLIAPGGKITLNASDAADPTGARVYLDAGSTTSVAGNFVDVPFADNLLTFKVTSNELKDSPNQKASVLKGATVTVDLRKGSPLLDLSGYTAAQGRTVAQKTAVGGEIDIASTGALIERPGALIDASGGGYRYGAGTAATSVLVGADGRLYDIGSAAEQRLYTGLTDSFTQTFERWGQTAVYAGRTYGVGKSEAAYVEGKPGGTIKLNSAAGLVLDGTLAGGAIAGPNQLANAPRGASLTFGVFSATEGQFEASQRIGNVTFANSARDTLGAAFGVASALSAAQTDNVVLAGGQLFAPSGQLFAPSQRGTDSFYVQNSFDAVELNSNGIVRVPSGVSLSGAPSSSLLVRAPQIDVAGSIAMPAGGITLQPVATLQPVSEDLSADRNRVTVRSGATLSTAGVWINNASRDGAFVGGALPSARLNLINDASGTTSTTSSTIAGGTLTIGVNAERTSATLLERGAQLDVGGGASLSARGKVTAGDGGTLSIANGLSAEPSSDWLQADLLGYSVGNGGKLVLSTARAVIDSNAANGTVPANTTRLSPSLFADRGFSGVTVNTVQGIAIQSTANVLLQQTNRVIDPVNAPGLRTGDNIRQVSTVERLADDLRQPVNLTLTSAGAATAQGEASITMAAGASIVGDPRANVTMTAVDGLRVDGRIDAPGGNVALTLRAPVTGAPDLLLGPTAALSVAGTFTAKPNAAGLVQGSVVGAGSVTISATQAGVNLMAGSQINLNGITRTLQSNSTDGTAAARAQAVDGNAGVLTVRSQGATEIKGNLQAAAGSSKGAGGAFALELNARDNELVLPDERRIVVTQRTPTPSSEAGFVDAALSVDALQLAGFQKIRLQSENRVELRGDVALNFERGIVLDAPLIDVTANGRASLQAANVALGQSRDPRLSSNAPYTLDPQGASAAVPSRAGAGVLSVQAGTIDLFGSTAINGVAETRLFSDGDIRMTGRNVKTADAQTDRVFGAQTGSLTTTGDVTLRAAQLYPSTRSNFTIAVAEQPTATPLSGGTISISSNGRLAGDVYSAGGRLTLAADTIVQGGTVKAPLGELDLRALTRLELSPGSLTTVSPDGLTIPFGSTLAGVSWRYQDNLASGTPNLLTTTSSDNKRIELRGKNIDVLQGATVNLAGGGEVQATEFVAGIGGSKDTLTKANTYAIIPKSKLTSMPVDTDLATRQDLGFGLQTARADRSDYDSIHIGSGAIVPEGDYVLLPARYALLPDAYLVQLQTGSAYSNLAAGQSTPLLNGQTVVSGYRTASGTSIRESSTVGVLVRPGSAATTESEYTVTTSSYFTDLAANGRLAAPRVPVDAGRLVVSNAEAVSLSGSFANAPGKRNTVAGGSGRAAEIDISAERIAVVDRVGTAGIEAGFLQLAAADLSALGGSLLLGGQRSMAGDAMQISTAAREVVVANSAASALKVAELIVSATDSIDVRGGSVLIAGGGVGTASSAAPVSSVSVLKAESAGALLRLSSGGQVSVDRGASVDNSLGELRIAAGAVLSTDRALLLDATRTTQSQGQLKVDKGGDVSLASSRVSLGETTGVSGIAAGLVLSNADLATLVDLNALRIKGYAGIDMYGSATLGAASLGSLTLDTGALLGTRTLSAAPSATGATGVTSATMAAKEVRFLNTGAASAANAVSSSGSLAVDAERIVVGAGSQKILGFGAVAMNASSEVVAQGAASLNVAADWTVRAPKVGVAAGAVQTWTAGIQRDGAPTDFTALKIDGAAGSSTAGTSTDSAAGGRLSLEGRSVAVGTAIQARSGAITVAAKGTQADDGVSLSSGALLDAAGLAKDFNGRVVTADAGSVALSATAGSVALAAGSTVNVSANALGGNAGSLAVKAAQLDLGGALVGTAAPGSQGGRAALELGALTNFSALNAALGAGGFNEAVDVRVRNGDVRVATTDVVKVREFQLAADAGRIDVAGQLDASSTRGSGSVSLWAANGLALAAGSRVSAAGTSARSDTAAAVSDGGRVRVVTKSGSLDFDAASTIDVSPGAKGQTGSVSFGVSRDAANVMNATQLAGTVLGKTGGNGTLPEVVLEATRSYTSGGTVSAANITAYGRDHAAFVNSADAAGRLAGLKSDDAGVAANSSLRGATEVRTPGDLNVASTAATSWNLNTPGWLAQGQPGTLTLRSAGNLTVTNSLGMANDDLINGQTWNIRLVGGADLAAANPMATVAADAAGKGSVLLKGNNAKVRTGTGSIEIAAATDFTMDSPRSTVYTAGRTGAADTAVNGRNRWSRDGGDISIQVGRDAKGAADESITEWLRRPRSASDSTAAEWWAYRPNFQLGIGTLGGGDVHIDAGRDVVNLSAMLPTTGRSAVDTNGARQLDVQGGGDLRLRATNDVIGGSYLIARGQGRIDAGGSVGAIDPTQLFLMGASSGEVPTESAFAISAAKGITLQSANNPTVLVQSSTTTGTGPSFGTGGTRVTTFFTYSPDSAVALLAKSGDVKVGSKMKDSRRLVGSAAQTDGTPTGAFPASLTLAALEGDAYLDASRSTVTYPSVSASVALLASGSLISPNIVVSDRLSVDITELRSPRATLPTQLISGDDLRNAGPSGAIVERDAGKGFRFDLQALTGDVVSGSADASTLRLPGESRVRAGRDIKNIALTLQNLKPSDVSEVRADTGDVSPAGLEIRGPGTLLIQAGRNIDSGSAQVTVNSSQLGGIIATGNNANASLADGAAARLTLIAGVKGVVDLTKFQSVYDNLIGLNGNSETVLGFFRTLNGDKDREAVTSAKNVVELVARDSAYAPFVDVLTSYPNVLKAYQRAEKTRALPLGPTPDAAQAAALYALLNRETDSSKIVNAGSVNDLIQGTTGGAAYAAYAALDKQYPRVFADYRARRSQGARPEGLTPIVFSDVLGEVTASAVSAGAIGGGNIYTFQSSIQTYGNGRALDAACKGQCAGQGDIDLWAPGGGIIAGLTTPTPGTTVGVVTNGGGAIRSVASSNFTINQGKVLTAQGGDILLYSSAGSVDAGKGAKTSISTPPPTRTPIVVEGVTIGYLYTLAAGAAGSGIQTLTSDPDGLGPLRAATAGSIYLFAPAGTIDAGEAGIRSGGNIVINAQTVLNASNIASGGSSVGVPVATTGSLASSLASAGASTTSTAADEASKSAGNAARAAAPAEPVRKPSILTVEVLGFGDKNCKEQDKDCFAK